MPAASVRGYVNKQSVPQKLIFPCLGGAWDLKHLSVKESGGNISVLRCCGHSEVLSPSQLGLSFYFIIWRI